MGEEDSTAAGAEDFMEAAEPRFAEAEVSPAEAALGSPADIAAATTEGGATTEVAAATVGAAGATVGAEDTVMAGAGDLALGGHIGVGDGAIPIATTARTTTRPTLIILIHTTVLRTIPRAIRILTTGTTIHRRPIPTDGLSRTRTDRQDPGDLRYREAERMPITETATSPLRRAGKFSPLTG